MTKVIFCLLTLLFSLSSPVMERNADFWRSSVAAEGTETFYRTMSQANYDTLMATGKLPATSETFISPSLEYASKYNGVTVQFNVQAGTTDSLLGMGVRNAGLNGGAYNGLPLVQSGWGVEQCVLQVGRERCQCRAGSRLGAEHL